MCGQTARARTACQGNDIDAASIEAHFGLHAVHDLHEAYFRPRRINGMTEKDKVSSLSATGGYAVGVLALGTL